MARVLILDNNSYLRRLYTEELVEDGHQVIAVNRCDQVLEVLEYFPIDVVVMEIVFSGQDGMGCLKEISTVSPHIRIIINSAFASLRDDPATQAADRYLLKSSDLTQLKKAIEDVTLKPRVVPVSEAPATRSVVNAS